MSNDSETARDTSGIESIESIESNLGKCTKKLKRNKKKVGSGLVTMIVLALGAYVIWDLIIKNMATSNSFNGTALETEGTTTLDITTQPLTQQTSSATLFPTRTTPVTNCDIGEPGRTGEGQWIKIVDPITSSIAELKLRDSDKITIELENAFFSKFIPEKVSEIQVSVSECKKPGFQLDLMPYGGSKIKISFYDKARKLLACQEDPLQLSLEQRFPLAQQLTAHHTRIIKEIDGHYAKRQQMKG